MTYFKKTRWKSINHFTWSQWRNKTSRSGGGGGKIPKTSRKSSVDGVACPIEDRIYPLQKTEDLFKHTLCIYFPIISQFPLRPPAFLHLQYSFFCVSAFFLPSPIFCLPLPVVALREGQSSPRPPLVTPLCGVIMGHSQSTSSISMTSRIFNENGCNQ